MPRYLKEIYFTDCPRLNLSLECIILIYVLFISTQTFLILIKMSLKFLGLLTEALHEDLLCNSEKLLMHTFFVYFIDVSCPLLESDLAYSDDDVPSVYENGLPQKSFNKRKENVNFLHLNRYTSLEN